MRNLVFIFSLMLVSAFAAAKGNVEINWQNPEKYSDVRSPSMSNAKYRAQVFKQLDEYFNELAADLTDNQTLKINVTNLDLAGQVWPASFVGLGHSSSDVRLIKSIDIPRMRFSYQLLDQSGVVIKEADADLKDMSFQDRHNPFFNSESLRYEKNMVKQWFEREFPDFSVKK
jgi:hypothetical protein